MPVINYKIELKLKKTSYCVLSAFGADNAYANSNNIISTMKDTLAEDLNKFIGMNLKQNVRIKINTTNEHRCFLELNCDRFFILV